MSNKVRRCAFEGCRELNVEEYGFANYFADLCHEHGVLARNNEELRRLGNEREVVRDEIAAHVNAGRIDELRQAYRRVHDMEFKNREAFRAWLQKRVLREAT
jgi:hypothetical protein